VREREPESTGNNANTPKCFKYKDIIYLSIHSNFSYVENGLHHIKLDTLNKGYLEVYEGICL